jgi:hypothetical protein
MYNSEALLKMTSDLVHSKEVLKPLSIYATNLNDGIE